MIAKSIGKRQFKQYLEIFFDVIFYGLVSRVYLFTIHKYTCTSISICIIIIFMTSMYHLYTICPSIHKSIIHLYLSIHPYVCLSLPPHLSIQHQITRYSYMTLHVCSFIYLFVKLSV